MEELKKLKAMREKYWKELNDSEKIERMRQFVKSAISKVDRIEHMVGLLLRHSHSSVGGKLQIPLEHSGENNAEWRIQIRNERDDEVFF